MGLKNLMKKTLVIYMSVLLAVFAAACDQGGNQSAGQSENSSAAGNTGLVNGTFNKQDMALNLAGVNIVFMEDSAPLLAVLGRADRVEEDPACDNRFTGYDKAFYYGGDLVILTHQVGGKDVINEIQIMSGKYAAPKGLKVGDTRERLTALYGDNFTEDGSAGDGFTEITYWLGEKGENRTPKLYFELENGKVTQMNFASAGEKFQ